MKRLELFEFEDYHWLPASIRTGVTNLIVLLHRLLGTSEVIAEQIKQQEIKNLTYQEETVDATDFSQTPKGLKTMVNSFHHLSPEAAKKIFHSAQSNQEPLLVYEMGENFVPTLLWWLLLPISLLILFVMVLFMTPFVKPLTGKQVLLTYVIPIIPIVYAWDGQASTMRTYTFRDIRQIIGDSTPDIYTWEMGKAKKSNGKNLGYYLFGYPK